jgi:hypothetical protein
VWRPSHPLSVERWKASLVEVVEERRAATRLETAAVRGR